MRWVARIFANAVARRVAALLVMAVLAWVGIGSAHAQSCTQQSPCDQGAAYSAAASRAAAFAADRNATSGWTDWKGKVSGPHSLTAELAYYQCYAERPVTGTVGCTGGNPLGRYYYSKDQTCASRPDTVGQGPWSSAVTTRNGTIQCNSGCETFWTRNADGTMTGTTAASGFVCQNNKEMCDRFPGYYWNAYLQACEPPQIECTSGQVEDGNGGCKDEQCPPGMQIGGNGTCEKKRNECPPGNVKAPSGECLPGEGQCAAGEAKGKDGTCKRDSNGDGVPDSEEGGDDASKDSASGGDSCNAPPSCNGNPIMCAQLRTQWRIDCNTRKNRNIAGGHCGPGGVPICTGEKCDAVEYAQLVQTWKTACAVEKLAGLGGGSGEGDPNVQAIKDALTGNGGAPDIGGEGNPGDSWAGGGGSGGNGSGEPDTAGYGWGGTCPTPPSIDLMGVTVQLDIAPLCNWLALGSYFVLGLAALGSLRIIGGGVA